MRGLAKKSHGKGTDTQTDRHDQRAQLVKIKHYIEDLISKNLKNKKNLLKKSKINILTKFGLKKRFYY